jgi:hypothetical protein
MSTDYCDFYCDESNTDGSGPFYLGALYCSPRRAELLRSKLEAVRRKYSYDRELKWSKLTSASKLPLYRDFTNVFLEDPYARFIVMKVKRNETWREWAPTENDRISKTYYVFLRMNMNRYTRYNVYLDYFSGKRGRWDKLRHTINNAVLRDHEVLKQVRTLQPVNSESCDLMQLTDLVLGGVTSNAASEAKTKLAHHARVKLQLSIPSQKPKLRVYDWAPELPTTRGSQVDSALNCR